MKQYSIVYADPPWRYDDKSKHRGGAERYYPTMSIEEICALPVASIAAPDCALFLWGTWTMMMEARRVVEAWGFEYKTYAFVWVKTNKRFNVNQSSFLPHESFDSFWGMGHWTRSNTEYCLLGVRGKPERLAGDVHQVIYEPVSRHSEKPQEARARIERLCGNVPRVELFARKPAPDWDVWGNEVEKDLELKEVRV